MIVKVRIVGLTPMLQNQASNEVLDSLWHAQGGALETGEVVNKSNRGLNYRQYCEKYCRYRGPKDEFGIPAQNLFASLRGGGRRVKLQGMTRVSSKDSTLLTGALTIQETFLPFENQDPNSWVADRRRGQASNSAKKAMVPIIRPRFDSWAFSVTVDIDKGEIPEDTIRRVFEKAGRTSGLGDFRPSTNGPFGQFRVDSWEVVEKDEEELPAAASAEAPLAAVPAVTM